MSLRLKIETELLSIERERLRIEIQKINQKYDFETN